MTVLNEEKILFNVLPLKDLVFFPHMVAPLIIGRKQSIEALENVLTDELPLFIVTQKNALIDKVNSTDLFRYGVLARVVQSVRLPNGLNKILVEGIKRAKVLRYYNKDTHLLADLNFYQPESKIDAAHEARLRHLINLFKDYVKLHDDIPEEIIFSLNQIHEAEKAADFISSYLEIAIPAKQKILEKWDIHQRINHLLTIVKKENSILSIQSDLEVKVRDQMARSQRNFYLQEQLRVIREELGEYEDDDEDVRILKEKIAEAGMLQEAEKKAMEEVTRLGKIPPLSPEYNVIRTYLEWLISLPWKIRTTDTRDIHYARKVLDEDHYGLEKPKKRILEYIAVLQRVQKLQGPILCLCGPPGVGKTSLGKSIARAMGRNFTRISLGGIHDEAEIRGHRRTYIGSLPGKIIQGIKKSGSINPVFLLDEIDKVGNDYRGDPSAALLEVLDPEQNKSFTDHYLEVEYDLSNVMFIVTANNPNEIPDPLYDRMEIIELPGYMDYEKMEIARRHLIPKQLLANGLSEDELSLTNEAVHKIILEYTMEAGVRSLEREISKICRRVVIRLSGSKTKKSIQVDEKNIRQFLGERKYQHKNLITQKEIGVATGLAWTSYGGDLLRVEVNLMPGKEKITLTGKLGEIMQESAMIAMAFIRSKFKKYKIDRNFLNKNEIHVHLPEGAVPKDGPSAGITLTSAILSALKKQPYPAEIAMTGEITLRGRILPVGGLNEKLLAAKRHGISKVILPADNRSDIRELDKELYQDMDLVYVKDYDEIYHILFKDENPVKNKQKKIR
ncbi:MAG: endopeptidase La [Calditrichaceae bacterium]|nr:endopeptidase La [Calditrichaceae bacterium]MBN2708417.1 endopeptidase La [Calditrichaceae bacterium]RQV92513.1 MAG: endopeptidase La [Calditrichota bacterium]